MQKVLHRPAEKLMRVDRYPLGNILGKNAFIEKDLNINTLFRLLR
jgi:hypothetical protein